MLDFEEYREIIQVDDLLKKEIQDNLQVYFTSTEIEIYQKRVNSLACRKLLKESLMNALEINNSYQEIEILSNDKGKPEMKLSEQIKEQMKNKGFARCNCSLSHSFNTIATLLILDRN